MIPAALLASTLGSAYVAYVLSLYLVINLADGYGLTRWIQKRAISVPAALVITAQVVIGSLGVSSALRLPPR